jgi:replicative DNA helicase
MTEREQTERAIVGCVLEQPDLVGEVQIVWFDDLRLGRIVTIVAGMQKDGKAVDICTVTHATGDPLSMVLLQECQAQCPSAVNFPYWREIITEIAEKERLKRAAQQFITRLPSANGDLPVYVAELENSLILPPASGKTTLTPSEAALALTDNLEQRMNLQGRLSGLATGFADLDAMLDGLQFGEVTILASRPSIGKTAIACNIVTRCCLLDKVPTLFLSLEMSASALCRRMLSAFTGLTMNELKAGRFTEGDFPKFASFDSLLKKSPLYIREAFGGIGAGEAAALMRRGVRRKQVRLVVIDYLQKLKPDQRHEKRTYEVAESVGALTAATKDTGVALLCLAQLSRESERDKGRIPRLSDLADSGQIERDADNVLLLHRDRSDPEKPAQLIVAKQRDGETGVIFLTFDGRYCRFGSATRERRP